MSIQAVGWALDQDLPARPKLVLVAIANHANHTDGYCWLKAETIAAEASCSPRAVFNFVGDLIRNGFIRKELRRADDGRQRSSDYWILFDRDPAPWQARGAADADEEADESAGDSGETQDVEGDAERQHAPGACGENTAEPVNNDTQPAPGASRPHAPTCVHKDSAEPSKTNPKSARARTPRGYRPPPPAQPPPMGATTCDGSGPMIFAFVGTPAYEAWQRVKSREIGRPWAAKTFRDGRWGWYFPSLFPPSGTGPPASADEPLATDQDLDEFAKTG